MTTFMYLHSVERTAGFRYGETVNRGAVEYETERIPNEYWPFEVQTLVSRNWGNSQSSGAMSTLASKPPLSDLKN